LTVFKREQLQTLVGLVLNTRASGYNVVIMFFCPGSIIFAYLFFKSRYIPKTLAACGIFSFLLMLIWTFVKVILPNYKSMIVMAEMIALICSVPVLLFQIIIGIWLLFKGINPPPQDNHVLNPA